MAKVVAFTQGISGHLYPFIPLLQALERRGHAVMLALGNFGPTFETFAQIPVVHIRFPVAQASAVATTPRRIAWQQNIEVFRLYGEALALEFERLMKEQRPDVVLIDPKLWGAVVAADALGIPWAAVAHNPLMFRGMGLDVRGPGLPPATNLLRRVQHRLLRRLLRRESREHVAEVNRVRRARGGAPVMSLDELAHLAPVTLATTAVPYEYPRHDWPPTMHFVGPMLWSPSDSNPPVRNDTDTRPLVLIGGSSVAARPEHALWAMHVINALVGQGYRLIATLPTEPIPKEPWPGVTVVRNYSHDVLLPHAACVVCHGGPGITHRALWYGVPVVAVPFAHDRFEVARRLEVSHAGVMLSVNDLTPQRVRHAVRTAIARKAGAVEVSRHFRAAGGAEYAATLIEKELLHLECLPAASAKEMRSA